MAKRQEGIDAVVGTFRRVGIAVYRSAGGRGSDLVVADAADRVFIPVKVVCQMEPGLNLQRNQIEHLERCGGVAAFVRGAEHWYLPAVVFRERAADPSARDDDRLYINVEKNRDWLARYEGEAGIRRAFAPLLG